MDIASLAPLRKLITGRRPFVLVGHRHADGDCLGVMSALAALARSYETETRLVLADPVPDHFRFLDELERVQVCTEFDCRGDATILLECGVPERSGVDLQQMGYTVNLDHHPDNTEYGDLVILDPKASSIGEMAVFFMDTMPEEDWTPGIADALYTAIHTDTGGFSYGNTSVPALKAAARLVEKGARPGDVCARVYQENDLGRLHLLGRLLGRLETRENGTIGVGMLTGNDLSEAGCGPGDTDTFSNWPRNIRGVEAGIFMLEQPDGTWKVSLRSKGLWVVNRTAAIMGGGGHRAAAGFRASEDPTTILERVIAHLLEDNEQPDLPD